MNMKNKSFIILSAVIFVLVLIFNANMIGNIKEMKNARANNEASVSAMQAQIDVLKEGYEKTSHTKMYKIDVFLQKAMEKIESLDNDKLCALIALDGDKFGTKTQEFGDDAVDSLVVVMAEIMKNHFPNEDKDMLCNIGEKSDEIFILLTERDDIKGIEEEIIALQNKIRDIKIQYEDKIVTGTISLGIVTFNPQESDFRFLFTTADDALYEAKNKGRDTYVIKQK